MSQIKKSCCARRRSIINLSGSCTVVKQQHQKPPYCSHYHRFDKFSNAALVFRVGMAIKWWAVSAICAKEFRNKKSKYGSNTETCCAWRNSTIFFFVLIVQKGFLRRVRRVCCLITGTAAPAAGTKALGHKLDDVAQAVGAITQDKITDAPPEISSSKPALGSPQVHLEQVISHAFEEPVSLISRANQRKRPQAR